MSRFIQYPMIKRLTAVIRAMVILTLFCSTSVFTQRASSESGDRDFDEAIDDTDVEWANSQKGVAIADIKETVIPGFRVNCNGGGQLCDPSLSVAVETGSVLKVQYFVPSYHCSSMRLHIYLDGTLKITTDYLGWPGAGLPLDTGLLDLGLVLPGAHILSVQGEGQASGCNSGQLGGWGGKLVVLTSTFAASEEVIFYHNDALGTPIAMTDAMGNMVWQADYKPFGSATKMVQAMPNSHQFIGKELDEETDLYYFGGRFYDPEIGRFMSLDPALLQGQPQSALQFPQRLNMYAYAVNNPYRYFDPDGKYPTEPQELKVDANQSVLNHEVNFETMYAKLSGEGQKKERGPIVWTIINTLRQLAATFDKARYIKNLSLHGIASGEFALWAQLTIPWRMEHIQKSRYDAAAGVRDAISDFDLFMSGTELQQRTGSPTYVKFYNMTMDFRMRQEIWNY